MIKETKTALVSPVAAIVAIDAPPSPLLIAKLKHKGAKESLDQ